MAGGQNPPYLQPQMSLTVVGEIRSRWTWRKH